MSTERSDLSAACVDVSAVFIFKSWEREPTYHDYGRIRDYGTDHSADVTKCGLVMYDRETRYAARLRRDHADLFAKPCRKCFSEEDE